uniref:Uncharacterized protein n=1 Tax=viral metagenome TaxID=1070528 RepID=A0A6H1ZP34_9ZZZZ
MQTTYEQSADRPLPFGAIADSGLRDTISAINSSPGAAQVDTVTVTNYVAAKTLTWTIDGVAFSYAMTVADADTTGVAVSLVAQLQADPIFGGRFVATSALGVVTLTGRFAGVGWTLVSTGTWIADFTVANVTANATGAVLPYGRLVLDDGQITGAADSKCMLGSAANMTAKVVVLTPTAAATTIYSVDILCEGITYTAQYDSTLGATLANICAALVAAINAMMPVQSVIASGGVTEVTLTAELAGLTFSVSFGGDVGSAAWTRTDTGLITDDVNECTLGIALRSDSIETNSETAPGYPANRVCSILKRGRVVVQVPSAITPTLGVWVRLANATATSPLGSFWDTDAADCVRLDARRFRWVRGASATRAILQVNAD